MKQHSWLDKFMCIWIAKGNSFDSTVRLMAKEMGYKEQDIKDRIRNRIREIIKKHRIFSSQYIEELIKRLDEALPTVPQINASELIAFHKRYTVPNEDLDINSPNPVTMLYKFQLPKSDVKTESDNSPFRNIYETIQMWEQQTKQMQSDLDAKITDLQNKIECTNKITESLKTCLLDIVLSALQNPQSTSLAKELQEKISQEPYGHILHDAVILLQEEGVNLNAHTESN